MKSFKKASYLWLVRHFIEESTLPLLDAQLGAPGGAELWEGLCACIEITALLKYFWLDSENDFALLPHIWILYIWPHHCFLPAEAAIWLNSDSGEVGFFPQNSFQQSCACYRLLVWVHILQLVREVECTELFSTPWKLFHFLRSGAAEKVPRLSITWAYCAALKVMNRALKLDWEQTCQFKSAWPNSTWPRRDYC